MAGTPKVVFPIGHRYGEDKQIEVLGVLNKCDTTSSKIRTRRMCKVKCHTCSLDEEMWGEAVFDVSVYDIKSGKVPCGCVHNPKLTRNQWDIKIARRVAITNYTYHGPAQDWKGQNTHLKLECSNGHQWSSCTIHNFMNGRSCPDCAKEISRKKRTGPDEIFIEKFFSSGMFLQGTIFTRKTPSSRIWSVECPACLPSIFYSDRSNLRAGKRPCDCGQGGGFDYKLDASFYVLKVVNLDSFVGFTGYGISNFLERRLANHKRSLSQVGMTITANKTFDMSGKEALKLEGLVKAKFEVNRQEIEGFRREATLLENYDSVIDYAEEVIQMD